MILKMNFSGRFWLRAMFGAVLLLAATTRSVLAVIPAAEKLLPPETLFVLSAPDWAKLSAYYRKAPQSQFWNDPAMKPFRDKFMAKWNDEIIKPLERDLGVKLEDYSALFQGQVTLAVLQEGWQGKGKDDGVPALVFLLDAKDKSELLKKNLAALRQQWAAAGKTIKTEKIRDVEFSIVTLTTNDVPQTMRRLLPQAQEVTEVGDDESKKPAPTELVIGQYESMLILSSTTKAAEKILIRTGAGGAPTLAEASEFEACQRTLFHDAPLYGWINTKTVFDVAVKAFEAGRNPEAPSPLPVPEVGRVLNALGLNALKSLAFDFQDQGDGPVAELFLSAPEAGRTGLIKILAIEPKDTTPPAFVPATAVKFSRVRLDGPKLIAALEKMVSDITPEGLNTWNFLLNNANEAARQDDPDFDIRKNIFGNLGDDLVTYEKAPKSKTLVDYANAPSIMLVGSPNPEKLAASLKALFVLMPLQSATPTTRELLGRKIHSLKLSGAGAGGAEKSLHYSASGGYVAFSTDESMIEDYLRSADSQAKPLRAVSGFTEAVAKIGGAGTGWLNYENQAETMRFLLEMITQDSTGPNQPGFGDVLASAFPFAPPEKKLKEWIDFSLLPSYDKISKYYNFVVSAGQTSVSGITFRLFAPVPPELLKK